MPSMSHPCGSLPVRGWNLSLWWCEHHQAYWATATSYRQHADDEPMDVEHRGAEFGPFDTPEDVERWLQQAWSAWKRAPLPSPVMPA